MLVFTDAEILKFITQYFYPFCRITGLFMAMPVMGARVIPARVKVITAFLVTVLVVPMLPAIPTAPLLSLPSLFGGVKELLIGVAIGFSFQVVFQVFVLGGQFIAMKMGLGFASMNDPANGVQTTVLSTFYITLITLMFICANGHLVLIELIIESFQTIAPGTHTLSVVKLESIARLGSWLFASAIVISLPILTGLLVVNIAFGVMSRAAPQLNIFAIGFPFTLICGMFMIWLGLKSLSVNFDQVMADGFYFVRELIEA